MQLECLIVRFKSLPLFMRRSLTSMEFGECMDLYFLIHRKYECLCDFRLNRQILLRLLYHLEVHLEQPT